MNFEDFLKESNPNLDPKARREADKRKLDLMAQSVAYQAMWSAGRNRFAIFILGFILIPPIFFHLAALPAEPNSILYGVLGLIGYAVGGVLTWFVGNRVIDGDPEHELERLMPSLTRAEEAYRKRWGARG